jgi:outer membrane protein OmpA-like peptidoglycan-associated protein
MKYVSALLSRAGICLALAASLAACSTTPERVVELEQARAAVQQLEREPKVQQAASETLGKARAALIRAETALAEGESLALVTHEAYVARRQAEIGMQLTSEAGAVESLREAERRRNELRLEARTVEAEQARMLAQRRAAEAERNAREAALSQSVAEAALDEADRLAGELKEMAAEQTERGVVLTLSDVLFDTGEADLRAGAMRAMDRLAEYMEGNPKRELLIEGHTDSRGSEEYNRQLAGDRANAVAEALVQRGITRSRLRTVGLGEAYPVASNENSAGRQENRRVEIVVSDPNGEFPAAAEERLTSG